jgi:hypothetical protein
MASGFWGFRKRKQERMSGAGLPDQKSHINNKQSSIVNQANNQIAPLEELIYD